MSDDVRYTPRERQLSLLAAIQRPSGVTRDFARCDIPAYRDYESPETFRRTFERDIAVLRDAGYPIRVDGRTYFFRQEAPIRASLSALDVGLVRSVLSGLGRRGSLRGAAHSGMAKLLASAASDLAAPRFLRAAIPSGEDVVTIARALQYGRRVSFDYEGSSESPRTYSLEPTRLDEHFGAFYVSGPARRQTGRQAAGEWGFRTFKVSRIVEGSLVVGAAATRTEEGREDEDVFTANRALLAVRPGCAAPLRSRGTECPPPVGTSVPPGWSCVEFGPVDRRELYDALNLYGRDVRLVGEEPLVREWSRRLSHLAGLDSGTGSAT